MFRIVQFVNKKTRCDFMWSGSSGLWCSIVQITNPRIHLAYT